ncbi:TauD/TfdA family dioxygenase [Paraburkholderia caribensis]|uniref:TauD/TfdA family dioxygenase n=1 Tax=Paraburkholderia caribensis TaxID=75105 RepID=UPI0018D33A14|nr:TauD/TfdA family dioxygenase [Paraburkholderia caribensis]
MNALTLSGEQSDFLKNAIETANKSGFDRTRKSYGEAFSGADLPLSAIRSALFESDEPYFVVKNLPIKSGADLQDPRMHELASSLLVGVTNSVGLRNFGYYQEKSGAILHDVTPVDGAEKSQSNAGRVEFGFHADNPFLPRAARPEVLALIGINNDAQAATKLMTIGQIKSRVDPVVLDRLRQPAFSFRHADSFDLNGYRIFATRSPMIKNVDGFDEMRCAVFTFADNEEDQAAVTQLKEAASQYCMSITLQPGDLLIFNNLRCMHGRAEVKGRRWLKRIYGARDDRFIDSNDQIDVWKAMSSKDDQHNF